MKITFALLLFWTLCNRADALIFQKKVKDRSINGILFIEDPESIGKNVGNLKNYVVNTYENGEVVFMLNKARSECLTLITSPGNGEGSFGEFEVTYNITGRCSYSK